MLVAALIIPRLMGGATLTVLSGSMSPTIPKGSIVLVKPVDPQSLNEGDVITWQVRPGESTYITHRIIDIDDAGSLSFVTQGDANPSPDIDEVPAGAVRGRVLFHVPFLGSATDLIRSRVGLAGLAIVGGLALLVGQVKTLRSHGPDRDELETLAAVQPESAETSEPALASSSKASVSDYVS